MNILKDISDTQINELIKAGFTFKHKSYEERLAECGNVAQPYKFDWGVNQKEERCFKLCKIFTKETLLKYLAINHYF